jgi:hypothetical protein
MKRRSLAAVLIATLVLTLTGCLRYNSIYYIQSDGTVSGQIYTALKEGYQTNSDPYKGTGAGDIAAQFPGATITDVTAAPWYAYLVSFSNAPLSSFAAVPSAAWQVQITHVGNVYKVVGYDTDGTTADTRNAINSNGGYTYLQIGFPGALKDAGNAASSGTSSGSGWAEWDLVNMTGTPYADGYGGLMFVDPGLFHFDPFGPTPGPVATPAPTPVPKPAVTVVITPSAAPSPSPSASGGASPSPTLTTIAAPSSGGSGGIPAAVWIVLAALVVALAGLGGFMLSRRGQGAGVAAAVAGGSGGAVPPTAVPPASGGSGAATPPASGDVADTVVMKAVEPPPADPTPPVTPKELPPDVV